MGCNGKFCVDGDLRAEFGGFRRATVGNVQQTYGALSVAFGNVVEARRIDGQGERVDGDVLTDAARDAVVGTVERVGLTNLVDIQVEAVRSGHASRIAWRIVKDVDCLVETIENAITKVTTGTIRDSYDLQITVGQQGLAVWIRNIGA